MSASRAPGDGSYRRTRGGRVECRLSGGPRWAREVFYGYGASEKEALAVARARQRIADADDDQLGRLAAGTVRDWAQHWAAVILVERVADGTLAETTRVSYAGHVDRNVVPRLGAVPLRRLSPPQVRAWLAELRAAGLSDRSRQYALMVLQMALGAAVRDEVIERNVAELVQAPTVRRARRDAVTVDHAKRLLAAAPGALFGAMHTVSLFIPTRPGELLGLEWDAVLFDGGPADVNGTVRTAPPGSLVLRHNLVRTGGRWRLHDLKGHRARVVPLPAVAVAALREHRARQAEQRLAAAAWPTEPCDVLDGPPRTPDLVFARPGTGLPVHAKMLGDDVTDLCKRAEVPRLTPHGLRHAAKTLLTDAGEPDAVVQQLGGWRSLEVADGYTGHLGGAMRDAVDRLAARLATDGPLGG